MNTIALLQLVIHQDYPQPTHTYVIRSKCCNNLNASILRNRVRITTWSVFSKADKAISDVLLEWQMCLSKYYGPSRPRGKIVINTLQTTICLSLWSPHQTWLIGAVPWSASCGDKCRCGCLLALQEQCHAQRNRAYSSCRYTCRSWKGNVYIYTSIDDTWRSRLIWSGLLMEGIVPLFNALSIDFERRGIFSQRQLSIVPSFIS